MPEKRANPYTTNHKSSSGKIITTSTMEADRLVDPNLAKRYLNDYSETTLYKNLLALRENHNIGTDSKLVNDIANNQIEKFNRYKIKYASLQLPKTFTYIFFTRPDLNFFPSTEADREDIEKEKLSDKNVMPQVYNNTTFLYFYKNHYTLMKSLTDSFSEQHDFNPFLSNMATSFDFSDEYIKSGEHGETLTGFKTKFGKNKIESITANNFSISYTDNNNLEIYKIHKMWVDYISKVYRGEFTAKRKYIQGRIFDYACSVYVIICGPDGESILFWTKYTGVFPTNIPSSAFNYSNGESMKVPNFSITYEYSWKEDFNPTTLGEFNYNSGAKTVINGDIDYAAIYEPKLGHTGKTFVNAPFIESVSDNNGGYDFKLRFRPDIDTHNTQYNEYSDPSKPDNKKYGFIGTSGSIDNNKNFRGPAIKGVVPDVVSNTNNGTSGNF